MNIFLVLCIILSLNTYSFSFRVRYQARQSSNFRQRGKSSDHDLLVRALRGESTPRTPVWLMRQAGRYLKEFRVYSEKYSFRERSENPEIAVELSLQPWRRFGVDGVIFFSDILTPLPAMGIDFTMVESKGPKILNPIRGMDDIQKVKLIEDGNQLPFVGKILNTLKHEVSCKTTLIGFIGAPWTLAAYTVEGSQSKYCTKFKRLCNEDPGLAHMLLDKLTRSLEVYADYQIDSGAEVIQIFDSWAHHMTEEQFTMFAKPYVSRILSHLKAKYPTVPVVYFANGGSGFLHQQSDMSVDALSIDWHISMKHARRIVGENKVIQGNVDPVVLYGSENCIRAAVRKCLDEGRAARGDKESRGLILNLGHGVEKDTPEESVAILVDEAKRV